MIFTYIDNNNRNAVFGDSKLSHNPITNPINNVHYNKYLNFSKTPSPQIKNPHNNITVNNNNCNIQTSQNNYNINLQKQIIKNHCPVNNYHFPNSILQNSQYTYINQGNTHNNNYINNSSPYPNKYNSQVLQPKTTLPYQIYPYQQCNITSSGQTLRQAASNFLN